MADEVIRHRRRPRYAGKNPRRFEEKYKEHRADPETVAKVLAAGKTPAGTHRSIMLAEVLENLAPSPGEIAVDCTLGYGGHAAEILARLQPGGRLIGLDVDPIELPKTEERLRQLGFAPATFKARRKSFAGLPNVLAAEGMSGVDCILADLGVSSMQLDDPSRGFSLKADGPLDMRMNPGRGQPACAILQKIAPNALAALLVKNADEPDAELLARALAGGLFASTFSLSRSIHHALSHHSPDAREAAVRRVFQTLRIAVNDELSVLDAFLRVLPHCLNAGGRVCILSFHSGEDRRVKKAFATALRAGIFAEISEGVIRAGAAERRENPRSVSAKLRWARRA